MNLITGATGFLGSHLALHLLEKGEDVVGIFRGDKSLERARAMFALYGKTSLFDRIDWRKADILDIPSLEKAFLGITRVYHCAAKISFDPKDEAALRKINIEGTANVVNLCLDFGVEKLCHVSSVAALGDAKENDPEISEDTEWNPEKSHSDYAISKYGAEMEIWRGVQEGLPAFAVNPGIILGPYPKIPGETPDGSGAIFDAIGKGFPFYTSGETGFVAVTDVCEVMHRLMLSDISAERFILVGQTHALKDIAFHIADALVVKRPKTLAKPWMTRLAFWAETIKSVFGAKQRLFAETVKALHRTHHFSNKKIRQQTEFEFREIPAYIKEIVRIQKS